MGNIFFSLIGCGPNADAQKQEELRRGVVSESSCEGDVDALNAFAQDAATKAAAATDQKSKALYTDMYEMASGTRDAVSLCDQWPTLPPMATLATTASSQVDGTDAHARALGALDRGLRDGETGLSNEYATARKVEQNVKRATKPTARWSTVGKDLATNLASMASDRSAKTAGHQQIHNAALSVFAAEFEQFKGVRFPEYTPLKQNRSTAVEDANQADGLSRRLATISTHASEVEEAKAYVASASRAYAAADAAYSAALAALRDAIGRGAPTEEVQRLQALVDKASANRDNARDTLDLAKQEESAATATLEMGVSSMVDEANALSTELARDIEAVGEEGQTERVWTYYSSVLSRDSDVFAPGMQFKLSNTPVSELREDVDAVSREIRRTHGALLSTASAYKRDLDAIDARAKAQLQGA